MTVRIGILGAANIAPTAVIVPAKDHQDIEVVAVAARQRDRAEAFAAEHDIPQVLDDYQAVIDSPDVDVVYIPTPAALHGRWTLKAIKAGKHVLCEKPFTANGEEAEEVAQAARHRGVVVMEAMHSQYHPLWYEALTALRSGEIGTVLEASAVFDVPIPDRGDIRWNPQLGGGALMDLGVYPLTLLRYLFGDLELISARAEDIDGVDYSLEGHYKSGVGADVALFTSMEKGTSEVQRLVVRGTGGTLTLDHFVHPQGGGSLVIDGDGGHREVLAEGASSYSHMLGALAAAVQGGGTVPTDAQAAVQTMHAIDELYREAGLEPRRPLA